MTEHEQKMLNDHAARVNALEWELRIQHKLNAKLRRLKQGEQTELLRQIEALL